LALIGGGDFDATDAVDRQLLARSGGDSVLVLPTADAFEHPERSVTRAESWFAARGGSARGLAVLARPDAFAPEHVAAVRESPFTYLVGDSPMHLRSVLTDTPLWDALVAAVADGAVVAASGPAAMARVRSLRPDPRRVRSRPGSAWPRPMPAVVPGAEAWSHDRLHRTLGLGLAFPVVTLATGSAVLRSEEGWEAIGEAVVHLAGAEVGLEALPPA
jgi:hypothetical protein